MNCNDGWGPLLVVLAGPPRQVWSRLPYGQSEDRAAPHFNDQAKLHSQRTAKRFSVSATEILDHVERVWGDRGRMERLAGR
jgi:acyl-homoserine-lactone acylase